MSHSQLKSNQILNKNFSPQTKGKALNCLTYGIKVFYGQDKRKYIIYQSEVDPELLMFLPQSQTLPSKLDFIDLMQVVDIQEFSPTQQIQNAQWLMLDQKNQKHYFYFNDQEDKNLLWQGILITIKQANINKQKNMKIDNVKQMALDFFSKADQDLSDNLTYDECLTLIQKLNVNISKKDLLGKFKFYDENSDKLLQVNEFIEIIRDLLSKTELKSLFQKYVPAFNEKSNLSQPLMKKEAFQKFLKIEQKQDELDFKQQDFLDNYFSQKNNIISYNDFTSLIFNYLNNIYDPSKLSVYQPMDQPLTDYFINSSHNTYLLSNQLTGDSSVEAYINAFRKGCRCIEIDVWDGNEPVVTHGFTLTSSIKFRDVIQTIKTYGFTWSKYPLIISIENHCNLENQKKMANTMKEILGNSMYLIPENYTEMKYYPTPRQLKRKIIIKAKGKVSQILEEQIQTIETEFSIQSQNVPVKKQRIRDSFLFSNVLEQDQIEVNQIYHLNVEKAFSENIIDDNLIDNSQQTMKLFSVSENTKSLQTFSQLEDLEQEDTDKNILESDDEGQTKSEISQVKDFQRCISMVGINFSMDQMKSQKGTIFDIFSLNEEKIKNLFKKFEKIVVDYHKKFFTRIYPKGSRINSSNFDPLPSFVAGSQIIALNFQTYDYPLFIYLSKFQQNGGIYSGYVLKPKYLRHSHSEKVDTDNHQQCDQNKRILQKYPSDFQKQVKQIKIVIISGQCLKREEDDSQQFNPFVEVNIKGTEIDEKNNQKQKTKVVSNNTFHPIFNSNPMIFKISCPELAMISFQIKSNGFMSDELIAQYALDFECIREGYRIIPLWDKEFKKIEHGMLLVHVEISDLQT